MLPDEAKEVTEKSLIHRVLDLEDNTRTLFKAINELSRMADELNDRLRRVEKEVGIID